MQYGRLKEESGSENSPKMHCRRSRTRTRIGRCGYAEWRIKYVWMVAYGNVFVHELQSHVSYKRRGKVGLQELTSAIPILHARSLI